MIYGYYRKTLEKGMLGELEAMRVIFYLISHSY